MKILITGGAGFIGANFIKYMKKAHPDDELVCLDALTYAGNLHNIEEFLGAEGFRFVRGDIADTELTDRLFASEEFDAVINFAAESHVDRSIENPLVFLETNIMGTASLLEAAKKHGVGRFHQVSTDEVYGDLPLDREDLFFTEETPLHTSSPYSSSKAAADLLAMSYYRTYGLPVTVSRCSNNYGPYQFPEKLIPLMIQKALKGESLPVYGDGLNVRDWLSVDDHCSAIDLILRKGRAGEVYNVGGHNERKNIDVVRTILGILGRGEESITYVRDRAGHDRRYAIDPTKIKNELGWIPETDFESGIKSTVEWYLQNGKWLEGIETGEYMRFNETAGKRYAF